MNVIDLRMDAQKARLALSRPLRFGDKEQIAAIEFERQVNKLCDAYNRAQKDSADEGMEMPRECLTAIAWDMEVDYNVRREAERRVFGAARVEKRP